jgi:hypothetical protein
MMTARKELLSGTPDEVAARLEKLSLEMPDYEYLAGTRLRFLAVELVKNPGLQVSVITYGQESQELEVRLSDAPECEPVTIDRNDPGDQCQVTCDRWLKIGTGPEIENAAELIGALLRISAQPTLSKESCTEESLNETKSPDDPEGDARWVVT